jgi:single-strand DNA-binding protein
MTMQQMLVLGRATKDAEILESKEGKKYARFSLAVNQQVGKGKEKEEKSYFYNVLVFNKTHERADLIKKGDLVMIDGRPDVDAYLSNEGEPRANMIVYANKWKLLK